ncbi:MAG: PAS domain S-box protein [Bacteroidales bacterium]|nr:PAS domain S-box protein [Bacteroidales bacterium]
MTKFKTDLAKPLHRFVGFTALTTSLIGSIVLFGWAFDLMALKSILPTFVTMKANTAIGFVLSGLSLFLLNSQSHKKRIMLMAKVLAGLVLLLGSLSLFEYLLHINFGIDQLVFADDVSAVLTASPGRMSATTAFCFIMIGASLLLQDFRLGKKIIPGQLFSLFVFMTGLIGLISYFYAQWSLLQVLQSTAMALHTAALFIILSMGVMLSHPFEGFLAHINQESYRGQMMRFLIPAIIVLPVCIEYFSTLGVKLGFFDPGLEPVVHTLGIMFILTILTWIALSKYETAERKQKLAEEVTYNTAQILQLVLNSIPQRIFWKDKNLNYLGCNNTFANDAGLNEPEELIGKNDYELSWKANADQYRADDTNVIQSGVPKVQFEEPQLKPDGHTMWLRTNKAPLFDKSGNIIGVLGTYEDISQAKKAEISIRESEEKFRSLFENMNEGFALHKMVYDQRNQPIDYIFLDANQTFENFTGLKISDILNKPVTEVIPGIEHAEPSVIAMYGEVADTGIEKKFELFFEPFKRWYAIRAFSPRKGYFATLFNDITEQKNAEMLIQTEKAYAEQLIDSLPGLFYQISHEGNFVKWNRNFETITGYDAGALVKMSPLDMFADEEKPKVNAAINQAYVDGYASVEAKLVSRNGQYIPYLFSGKIITLGDQSFLAGMGLDMTFREEALSQLKINEEKFRSVFENSPIGKSMTGIDGSLKVNKAFCEILGYSAEALSKIKWQEITHPEDVEESTRIVSELISGVSDRARYEKRYLHKNGNIVWADVSTSIQHNSKGTPAFFITTIIDITDKKRRENELILKNIVFDTSVSANSTSDTNGILNNVNEAFVKIWGYQSPGEVLGRSIGEFIKYEHDAIEIITSLNKTGFWKGEYIGLKKDGSTFMAQANASVLKDVDDKFIGYQSTVIDITEKKQAEEERNRFFNLALDFMCVAGMDGYFKRINPSWTQVFGWSEEEFLTRPFFDFIHPDDIAPTTAAVSQLSKQNPVMNFTNRYRCKDGTYRWLAWASTPHENSIYAAAHDITEIKNAQVEVNLAKNKLELAIKGAEIGIWEWDLKTGVTTWDERMEEMFGFAPGTFGKDYASFKQCLHPDDVALTEEAIRKALEENKQFDVVYRVIWKTGDIKYIKAMAVVVLDEANAASKMIGVCHDLTKIKTTEEQLRGMMLNLERSNKELEQFAYIASHDLQEPLRMVSSYTQLLERRYKDKLDQDANEFISYAVDGATRMQRLINDLLEYSRVTTKGQALVKIDLSVVLQTAIQNLKRKIEETETVITCDELPFALGDSGQLVRVFQNLIDNAIKFINNKKPLIHISASTHDGMVEVSVKDNGIGIEKQYENRIYTIFQRLHAKHEYPGTGLGLAICKRTIERHGGRMWFDSVLHEGTTFYFTLKK